MDYSDYSNYITMDYNGLQWIIMEYSGSQWTIMDCNSLINGNKLDDMQQQNYGCD